MGLTVLKMVKRLIISLYYIFLSRLLTTNNSVNEMDYCLLSTKPKLKEEFHGNCKENRKS